jgi:pinin
MHTEVDSAEAKEDGANNAAAAAEGREDGSVAAEGGERRGASNGGFRRDGSQWVSRRVSKGNTSLEEIVFLLVDAFPVLLGGDRLIGIVWLQELDNALPEPLPRPFPKDEDQSLVRRNRRMLGKLLVGTLEVTNYSTPCVNEMIHVLPRDRDNSFCFSISCLL